MAAQHTQQVPRSMLQSAHTPATAFLQSTIPAHGHSCKWVPTTKVRLALRFDPSEQTDGHIKKGGLQPGWSLL